MLILKKKTKGWIFLTNGFHDSWKKKLQHYKVYNLYFLKFDNFISKTVY